MPTLEEFRNQTGEFAPETEQVQDAAAQQSDVEPEVDQPETVETEPEIDTEPDTSQDEQKATIETPKEDSLPELSEKEKPAFVKRLEAEKRKWEEAKQKELEERLNPYKRVMDKLGVDLDTLEQIIEQNRMQQQVQQEAAHFARQYGWDEEQTQYYIQQQTQQRQLQLEQQRFQKELQELRIANEIHELRDNPSFSGIINMKKEIVDLVSRSNGALNVQQAYWALGGAKRAEQMKLEAEQRAAVKRAETRRSVQNDHASVPVGPKPLPPEIAEQARRMGLTEQQARELLEFDATNIIEARQKRKKA